VKPSTLYITNRMEADSTSHPDPPLGFCSIGSGPVRLAGLAAGLALRLWMLKKYFLVKGLVIYGDMAKHLLLHGSMRLTGLAGLKSDTDSLPYRSSWRSASRASAWKTTLGSLGADCAGAGRLPAPGRFAGRIAPSRSRRLRLGAGISRRRRTR